MKISTFLLAAVSFGQHFSVALAGEKPKKLKKEFKGNVFTAKDDKGRLNFMSQRAEDEVSEEVTVEAMITLGDSVSCDFGIIAKKGGSGNSDDKPLGWMECFGELEPGALEDLESVLVELAENAETECGERYKQCPPNFAYGMLDYLILYIRKKGKLPTKWKKKIEVSNTFPVERIASIDGGERRLVRRRQLALCSATTDPALQLTTSTYPRPGDEYCPEYTSWYVGDDGATCMCPWSGGPKAYALYDAGNGQKFKWPREYGGDSYGCAGRCGITCNSLDKEAFWDCFDHDSCLEHLGGNTLVGNPDCGDEVDEAADDYLVSYGYCCCTCNWWIGCYC